MSLDFSKKILRAVSFDKALFQKELRKILKWLNNTDEVQKFQEWCIVEFGAKYPKIIQTTFAKKIDLKPLRIKLPKGSI